MQTLILSCNTGAGHNSCAQAVQEALSLIHIFAACFMTNPRQSKESTARESNYIGLNQSPISDMIQNGQTISDRNSSEERQREVELESALLGEAIKKQESLTRIQNN